MARYVKVLEESKAIRPVAVGGAAAGTGFTGSLSLILVWGLGKLGVDMPPEVAAAVVVVVMSVVSVLAPRWALDRLHASMMELSVPDDEPGTEPAPPRSQPAREQPRQPQQPRRSGLVDLTGPGND